MTEDTDALSPEQERQLLAAALRYYRDTMPGYAAAAHLSRESYALVMVDVERAKRLVAKYDKETK